MKKSLGAKTLVYPTPVLVVCTYDHEGNPNAMTAAWGGILLLIATLCHDFTTQGHLYLWEPNEQKGFHSKYSFRKLC